MVSVSYYATGIDSNTQYSFSVPEEDATVDSGCFGAPSCDDPVLISNFLRLTEDTGNLIYFGDRLGTIRIEAQVKATNEEGQEGFSNLFLLTIEDDV